MTLKEIALELLEKYESSETECIWEYSVDITGSEQKLYSEIRKYRRMIEDAEPKQGEWEFISVDCSRCSECGYLGKAEYNYCPNCGAKMKGADDE